MDEYEQLVEGKVDWKGRAARKDEHGGMRNALFPIVSFAFDNLANLGWQVNFVTYFTMVMHYSVADGSNVLTNFMGTSFILSIVVAYLADGRLGRFKAAIISLSLELLGFAILTVQAHYQKLKPPLCNIFDPLAKCEGVDGGNKAMLFVGLYTLALGISGVKAALPTLGADQFDEKDPKEARMMSTFFNGLLLALCVGGSFSLTLFVWIQDHKGWDWGFFASTMSILVGIIVFGSGLPKYRIHVQQGSSAFTQIIQVYVAAFRNRNHVLPEDAKELYEIDMDKEAAVVVEFLPHTQVLKCLDKAAIRTTNESNNPSQSEVNPWKQCRVTQVENAKILLSMVPVFCCTIIMTLCLAQLQTLSILQGSTMDTKIHKHFNMPAASIPIIPVVSLLLLIPAYDQLFVPFARKITNIPTGVTHLQRVGVGLVLSSISMGLAAIVEVKRKGVARDHNMLDAVPGLQPLPISVFWLTFQYFVFGIADMFTYVGLLEFFYSEAPKSLKSISTCFLWCSMALGYFLSTILIQTVNAATKNVTRSRGWLAGNNINRNHLNLFYWLLSIMSLINFAIYLFVAKRYEYRPQTLRVGGVRNKVHEVDELTPIEN